MAVGCSDATRTKWFRMAYLMKVQAEVSCRIMRKYESSSRIYNYFDFFGGPGVYSASDRLDLEGEYGSPIRAIRVLKGVFAEQTHSACMPWVRFEPLSFRCLLFDLKESCRLQSSLRSLGYLDIFVHPYKCEEAVEQLTLHWRVMAGYSRGSSYGLAFFDPNGVPPWEHIRRFAECPYFSRVDLLINVNSTACKRVFYSPVHDESMRVTERLRWIGKRYIYLWEPSASDNHGFGLAFLTNWGGFPIFPKDGFHRIDSPEGQRIARRMDYSRKDGK